MSSLCLVTSSSVSTLLCCSRSRSSSVWEPPAPLLDFLGMVPAPLPPLLLTSFTVNRGWVVAAVEVLLSNTSIYLLDASAEKNVDVNDLIVYSLVYSDSFFKIVILIFTFMSELTLSSLNCLLLMIVTNEDHAYIKIKNCFPRFPNFLSYFILI